VPVGSDRIGSNPCFEKADGLRDGDDVRSDKNSPLPGRRACKS
jgi:hypothetical protein